MAICASPSDQFNSRSSRTMTDRCRSWTRTQQGGNTPISLKTQVDRTAKTTVTARRTRVGGLCGFRGTAERIPTESLKTGRCADVRELWRKWQAQSEHQREAAASPRTFKRAKSRDFGRCGEKAARKRRESRTKPRGRARPAAVTSARGAGSFGDLRGRSKSSENRSQGVADRKKPAVSRKTTGFQ